MLIENVLVLKNYNIKTSKKYTTSNVDLIDSSSKSDYNKMQETLIKSAKHFLTDLHTVIVDTKEIETTQDMFKDHMMECYTHWSAKPRNILYCDLDVLFVNQCNIFNQGIKEFLMPSSSCAVRYYPHTMSNHIWDTMLNEHALWDTSVSHWEYEQDIYKKMKFYNYTVPMYDTRISIGEIPITEVTSSSIAQNLKKYHAIHFHSTRDTQQCAFLMSAINSVLIGDPAGNRTPISD